MAALVGFCALLSSGDPALVWRCPVSEEGGDGDFFVSCREEHFLLILSRDNHSLWKGATTTKKGIIQHLL